MQIQEIRYVQATLPATGNFAMMCFIAPMRAPYMLTRMISMVGIALPSPQIAPPQVSRNTQTIYSGKVTRMMAGPRRLPRYSGRAIAFSCRSTGPYVSRIMPFPESRINFKGLCETSVLCIINQLI